MGTPMVSWAAIHHLAQLKLRGARPAPGEDMQMSYWYGSSRDWREFGGCRGNGRESCAPHHRAARSAQVEHAPPGLAGTLV